MKEIFLKSKAQETEESQLQEAIRNSLPEDLTSLKKVLIVPPDFTRLHSQAGKITAYYYELLHEHCQVEILPALGTHEPMNLEEFRQMFGKKIPWNIVIVHDWRKDIQKIGEVPAELVKEVSEGLMEESIPVEIHRKLLDPTYDLILSIGQVVPHEVVGMANYSKNILVGCGGKKMIDASHMLGAVYGMERIMGKDHSPVRKVFDYAQEHFLKHLPLHYILTVIAEGKLQGLFIGRERNVFVKAVELSQEKNLTILPKRFAKVIVYLDEMEFKSTWLGNKAIYRTRMAIADGGELIILAPGIRKFGEDPENDSLIRKFGYIGREKILQFCKKDKELSKNLSVAAHLIHGSSDGRFSIHYAVEKITREEIEKVAFSYKPLSKIQKKYPPKKYPEGIHKIDEIETLVIHNPGQGLWMANTNQE